MATIERIPVPLRHVGSVNVWLLRGDPLTLVDTGPRNDEALTALETGLRFHGVRLEDLELVLATHHHLDHVGLTATIKRRSGARVAVIGGLADYALHYPARVAAERLFSRELMATHGVPAQTIADNEGFWDYIHAGSEAFSPDIRLVVGDRIRGGGRDLRVVLRPGHSTTDTLFVDDAARLAFVGDHVLERISSNTEIYPGPGERGSRPGPGDRETRPRARLSYLKSLQKTAAMPLERLLPGHGRPVTEHTRLIGARLAGHRIRSRRIAAILERGPSTAYGVAEQLWPAATVREQPLLVLWEVLGHLDLLMAAGVLDEEPSDDEGHSRFVAASASSPRLARAHPDDLFLRSGS
jgi:glyoxylase-like metal-dependent hydrolase (beta-lactamase superfamily II)